MASKIRAPAARPATASSAPTTAEVEQPEVVIEEPAVSRPKTATGSKAFSNSDNGASNGAQSSRAPTTRAAAAPTAAATSARANGDGAKVNIKVAIRIRPANKEEVAEASPMVLKVSDSSSLTLRQARAKGDKEYTFDHVFDGTSTQAEVYDAIVVPVVEEVIQGFNCTIFAYGQTGTGKTYTMEGVKDPSTHSFIGAEGAGIVPRTIQNIFATLNAQDAEYTVRVSYLELYNEELIDLLAVPDPANPDGRPLRIFDTPSAGICVGNLEEVPVKTAADIYAILERGSTQRQVAATHMNKTSSRSHTVFTITLHIKESTPEGEDLLKVGKLNLVDLAGSENIGRSGARDARAREAGLINQSLLTLGRVINGLVERQKHIAYRESKLTRLLQDSLGGTTKTCIIATVSPAALNAEETISTLDYASRAKTIQNRPVANQKMTKRALIKEYVVEIDDLRRQLSAAREQSGVYLPTDKFDEMQLRIAGQADAIETLERTLEERAKAFGELRGLFGIAEAELGATRTTLARTEAALAAEAAVAQAHAATEAKLLSKGAALQAVLADATGDLAQVHAKAEAQAAIEAANADQWSDATEAVCAETAALKAAVAAAAAGHAEALTALAEDGRAFVAATVAPRLEAVGAASAALAAGVAAGLQSQTHAVSALLAEVGAADAATGALVRAHSEAAAAWQQGFAAMVQERLAAIEAAAATAAAAARESAEAMQTRIAALVQDAQAAATAQQAQLAALCGSVTAALAAQAEADAVRAAEAAAFAPAFAAETAAAEAALLAQMTAAVQAFAAQRVARVASEVAVGGSAAEARARAMAVLASSTRASETAGAATAAAASEQLEAGGKAAAHAIQAAGAAASAASLALGAATADAAATLTAATAAVPVDAAALEAAVSAGAKAGALRLADAAAAACEAAASVASSIEAEAAALGAGAAEVASTATARADAAGDSLASLAGEIEAAAAAAQGGLRRVEATLAGAGGQRYRATGATPAKGKAYVGPASLTPTKPRAEIVADTTEKENPRVVAAKRAATAGAPMSPRAANTVL